MGDLTGDGKLDLAVANVAEGYDESVCCLKRLLIPAGSPSTLTNKCLSG